MRTRATTMRSAVFAVLATAIAIGSLAARDPAARAADPPPVYVTSTGDGPPGVCEGPSARRPCTLRDAIETVAMRESGRVILARYCAAGDPGPYCLSPNDPNYDAARRVWNIALSEPYGFDITGTNVTIDFAEGVPAWASAAHNAVEVATGDDPLDWLFGVDGEGHVLRGFNLRGDVRTAAVVLYNGARSVRLDALALADIDGDAIRIRDEHTQGNQLSGIQCGWLGPPPSGGAAQPPSPITGACLEFSRGAHDNAVGDGSLRPSVFANAAVGVRVTGRGTRANRIARARIDSNGVGVQVADEAAETALFENTVVRSEGDGIDITGASWNTVVEGNHIGVWPEGGDLSPAPNGGWGVDIAAPAKAAKLRLNTIRGNGGGGVRIAGRAAEQHLLTVNLISGHDGPAIRLEGGANRGIAAPELSRAGERIVVRSCPRCAVELFSDPADEALVFVAQQTADNGGQAVFTLGAAPAHRFLTATGTDPDGNSSALSAALDTMPPPDPTATAVGPAGGRAYLPLAWRGLP